MSFSGTKLRKPKYYDNNQMVAFDKLGQQIFPDSYIIYGYALGRCAGLRFGKVLSISYCSLQFKIKVWSIDDDGRYEPSLLSKPSTLNFPERMTVIPKSLVPPDFLELLEDVTNVTKSRDIEDRIRTWKNKIVRKPDVRIPCVC